MTVAGVTSRKPKWKQLLGPVEIPAARFSCVTSGSFRPKLGLCLLLIVLTACLAFVVVPFVSSSLQTSRHRSLPRRMSLNKAKAAAAASLSESRFLADLQNAVKGGENYVLSSLSVSSVMGMLLAGARGDTEKQIRRCLRYDGDAFEGLGAISDVLADLSQSENFTLRAANRVYVDSAFGPLLPEFVATLKSRFRTDEPKAVDFAGATEPARKEINSWVGERTNGKVADLLAPGTVSGMTVAILINALYFKGSWANKFDEKRTLQAADFQVDASTTVKVAMMRQKGKFGLASLSNGTMALRMPYRGEAMDMIFILPNPEKPFEDLEAAGIEEVATLPDNLFMSSGEVNVAIPRFKLESTHGTLVDRLAELGMSNAFDPAKADLSGISGTPNLFVSKVVQKAFVEVNEEGSEAAAATAVITMMRSAPFEFPFHCDRPFYFMIRDRASKLVLFSGKVADPTRN